MADVDARQQPQLGRVAAAGIGHIGLTVPSVDRAVAWYASTLGWTLVFGPVAVSSTNPSLAPQLRDVFDAETVEFRQAHMLAGDSVLVEFFEFLTPPAAPTRTALGHTEIGIFHLCVVTDDVPEVAKRIAMSEGRQRTRIHRMFPDRPLEFCYCEDPFGNAIEVANPLDVDVLRLRQDYER
jgi:catechol 2,3-dioxygenase-like lactoylglutathione lyase family enzyme